MMKKILFFMILIAASLVSNGQLKKGYEIDVNISGLQDSAIYLAYHLGDKQYIKDTVKLDKKGHGIFRGPESTARRVFIW